MISFEEALGHFNIGKVWFGWENSEAERNYDNLVVIDETATKPTEEEINAKILELQFIQDRKSGYPAIGDQLDMLFHAIDGDETLKTQFADFHTALKEVKDQYPKG